MEDDLVGWEKWQKKVFRTASSIEATESSEVARLTLSGLFFVSALYVDKEAHCNTLLILITAKGTNTND